METLPSSLQCRYHPLFFRDSMAKAIASMRSIRKKYSSSVGKTTDFCGWEEERKKEHPGIITTVRLVIEQIRQFFCALLIDLTHHANDRHKHCLEHVIIASVSHWSDSATKHVRLNSASASFDATRDFESLCLLQMKRSTDRSPENDCWYNCTYTKTNSAGFCDLQIVIVVSITVPQDTSLFVPTHFLVKFWR